MNWKRLLAYISGWVDQELLIRNEYLVTENRILRSAGVEPVALPPPRSPNLNAHPELWNRSVKEECLSKLILFGEASLRHVLSNYSRHYHTERNHQGKDKCDLVSSSSRPDRLCNWQNLRARAPRCLLKFYHREARLRFFDPSGKRWQSDLHSAVPSRERSLRRPSVEVYRVCAIFFRRIFRRPFGRWRRCSRFRSVPRS